MFKRILSLRITDREVSAWLDSKKSTERSINTIIVESVRKEMKRDKKAKK